MWSNGDTRLTLDHDDFNAIPRIGEAFTGQVSAGRGVNVSRVVASVAPPSPAKSDEPPMPDDMLTMMEEDTEP